MTNKDKAELCQICEKQPIAYNDLCTDCLAKALSGKQKSQVTAEEATRVLLSEQVNRVQTAQKEAEAIYAKYRVALDVYMIVRAGVPPIVQVQFVPAEGWAGDPSMMTLNGNIS